MRILPFLLPLTLLAQPSQDLENRALALHQRILTLDSHCDTPMLMANGFDAAARHPSFARGSGRQDLPRMRDGGLAASFFAVFEGQGPRTAEGNAQAKARALATLDSLDRLFLEHPEACSRGLRAADAARIFKTGKRAIFIGMENGYPVGSDLANVDLFHARGVRYITLAHTSDNDLCASSTDRDSSPDSGLTPFGAAVVARMNQLGMMVDVSHISERSFYDVLRLSKAPVIASHSCARALCDHPRNLSDDQLRALRANGGVVQLCILADYVKTTPVHPGRKEAEQAMSQRIKAAGGWPALSKAQQGELEADWDALQDQYPSTVTVKDAVDHIDHIVKTIGIDHVGIGTDFDGGGGLRDCRDVTQLPAFTLELLRRGYRPRDIRKIWGGNFLRVMAAVERKATVGRPR